MLLDRTGQIAEMNAVAKRLLNCVNADLSGLDFWDAVLPDVAERQQLATEDAIGRLLESRLWLIASLKAFGLNTHSGHIPQGMWST